MPAEGGRHGLREGERDRAAASREADGDDGIRLPRARKRFGQHFLTDRRALLRIVDAVDPESVPCVVEIGPGRGALTDLLAERAQRLIAIELDRDLAAHLRRRYADRPHVEIVEADVLETDIGALAGGEYALCGNVPYYITTPIIFHALQAPRATRAIYLVQREVADRMTAAPSTGEYGGLTVNVQAVAEVSHLFRVPPGSFAPPPKVESAVVRVTPREHPLVAPGDEPALRELVTGAFGLRRKQMRRVVRTIARLDADAADVVLAAAGIEPMSRPEELPPAAFVALLAAIRAPR